MNNIKNLISIILALLAIATITGIAFIGFLVLLGVAATAAIIFYIQNIFKMRSKKPQEDFMVYETGSEDRVTKITIIEGEAIEKN